MGVRVHIFKQIVLPEGKIHSYAFSLLDISILAFFVDKSKNWCLPIDMQSQLI